MNTSQRMTILVAVFGAAIAVGIAATHFLGRGNDGISRVQAIDIAQREIQREYAAAEVIGARADRFDAFWRDGETDFALAPGQRVWAVAFRGTFTSSCGPPPPPGEEARCPAPYTTMTVILNYGDGAFVEEASGISGFATASTEAP